MTIEIVSYDCAWPTAFEAEAATLREGMRGLAKRIEHVGSTSVPGLEAKPVIDIQVSVATLANLDASSVLLARLGYTHVALGAFDSVYPFFRKPAEACATHHLHLCVFGGEQERRHVAFRDYLRRNPAVALEYVKLKRSLADAHDGATLESRERYSLAKTPFISAVLERSRIE